MNAPVQVADGIHWVGANDRTTELFEAMWPLERGISYNAYVVRGEKTALVDTVKNVAADEYLGKIRAVVGDAPVDYLIVNHLEPDHSGAMPMLLDWYPEMQIVGVKRLPPMLADFYGCADRLRVVDDGDELDLGGRALTFVKTPMVHWPETMMTYDAATGVLFSGDAFGTFGALEGGLFDDEADVASYEDETLRYFANVIGKYTKMVRKAIAKVEKLDVRTIAPTHGPVWRHDPAGIVARYDRYSRYEAEPGVVVIYGSMYGSTATMAEAVARGVTEAGCPVVLHDVSRRHASYALRDAWRHRGIVLGSPTYDANLFPLVEHVTNLLEAKGLANRVVALFGSYGWGGGAVKQLQAFAERMEWRLVEPIVQAKGTPEPVDLDGCVRLGRQMAAAIGSQVDT